MNSTAQPKRAGPPYWFRQDALVQDVGTFHRNWSQAEVIFTVRKSPRVTPLLPSESSNTERSTTWMLRCRRTRHAHAALSVARLGLDTGPRPSTGLWKSDGCRGFPAGPRSLRSMHFGPLSLSSRISLHCRHRLRSPSHRCGPAQAAVERRTSSQVGTVCRALDSVERAPSRATRRPRASCSAPP